MLVRKFCLIFNLTLLTEIVVHHPMTMNVIPRVFFFIFDPSLLMMRMLNNNVFRCVPQFRGTGIQSIKYYSTIRFILVN